MVINYRYFYTLATQMVKLELCKMDPWAGLPVRAAIFRVEIYFGKPRLV